MEKVIKILAEKYNLSEDVVEKVIRSEFNFVADTMSKGEFESVHLHYFGKFAVRPNRLKQIEELNDRRRGLL